MLLVLYTDGPDRHVLLVGNRSFRALFCERDVKKKGEKERVIFSSR